MNILVLIGIIFALSGFKPKGNTDNNCTQGYYQPEMSGWAKRKMGSTNMLDLKDTSSVAANEYYLAPYPGTGQKFVWIKYPAGHSGSVEPYNPMNYTVGNCT